MKNTVNTLLQQKKDGNKITMLTCYDYSTAKLMEEVGVNTILVGDSLGNTMLGYEDTIQVTMEDMIHHSAAVSRGLKNTLLVCDMPFMSYQTSVYDAVVNAGRLMKEGHANMVKLEGGVEVVPQIEAIVKASIPVCAHIGLTPQSINAFGGFKVQGKTEAAARKLIEDAKAGYRQQELPCWFLKQFQPSWQQKLRKCLIFQLLELVPETDVTDQVLVYQDMLGMFTDYVPKFVRQFANVGEVMKQAFTDYINAVGDGSFPKEENTYKIDDEIIDKLY